MGSTPGAKGAKGDVSIVIEHHIAGRGRSTARDTSIDAVVVKSIYRIWPKGAMDVSNRLILYSLPPSTRNRMVRGS